MTIYSPPLPKSVGRELRKADAASLECEDIQHILIHRSPALAARYEFLTFRKPAAGRAWLRAMTEKVTTAAAVRSGQLDTRWVFSSIRRHAIYWRDWSSDVCSSDLYESLSGIRQDWLWNTSTPRSRANPGECQTATHMSIYFFKHTRSYK